MRKNNKARSAMSELLSKSSETQLNIEPRTTVQKRTGYIETLGAAPAAPARQNTQSQASYKTVYAPMAAVRASSKTQANATAARTTEQLMRTQSLRREVIAAQRSRAIEVAETRARTEQFARQEKAQRRTPSADTIRDTCNMLGEKAEGVRRDVGRVLASHAETGKKAVRISAKVMRAVITASILVCLCTGIISAVVLLNPDDAKISEVAAIGTKYSTVEAAEAGDAAEAAAAPAAVEKTDNGRYNVTFTFYQRDSVSCTTESRSVGELVGMLGISLSDEEIMRTDLEQVVSADTVVSVDAVSYGTDKSFESVPYETEYVDVQTIPRGTTRTHQSGKSGTKTIEYTVTYVNGAEAERAATDEYISTYPTKCIVYRGVGGTVNIGGVARSYSYYIDCSSTVYRAGGTTATGAAANEGVIAVDPRVIPLGSSCYISGYYSGVRTAADTGGGIGGNKIDICFSADNPMLYSYGRRSSRVYILG